MISLFLFLSICCIITNGIHFNGGTIRWEPVYPYINSSNVSITIIQTYSWTYPTIDCSTNVPISTSGRSSANANLTCVTDCSTDGGYHNKPVNILTDCQTFSSSLGMMTSQRSVNITLTANAHFYLAYVGSAWVDLNDPPISNLQWSIVCSIDLRMRSDGFINTPPVATVVSPQYAIVNQTTQITIPVSDANAGDDVRCRWATYTPGYRRRRRSEEEEQHVYHVYESHMNKNATKDEDIIHIRKKRKASKDPCTNCYSTCANGCSCSCSGCTGTTCSGKSCKTKPSCPIGTTTIETPGTLKPTSSYANRQAIDECGGICFPSSVPSGTTLSSCTISFIGLVPDTWYGIAVQVEDFINSTSNISMSSVPVQFLIYVMAQPTCGLAPVIVPLSRCFDVQVGVLMSFNLSAVTKCNSNVSAIDSIVVTNSISGMNVSDTIDSLTNASVSYVTFTWKPQTSQLGSQQLCTIAYSEEQVQSQQYCVTFTVITSSATCITTTTTTTTTTSKTTTTTSRTTTTTSTSTTTETTTTTSVTTSTTSTSTTSTTTTTTSTTTETTTTTSVTTTTTETTTTTSVTTTTSTTSTTSTSTTTSTTTSSSSTSTTTTTTTTTVTSATTTTTTTATTTTITTTTTAKTTGQSVNWLLILGLSLLALLLAICCCCCCLYCWLWGAGARRRRRKRPNEESEKQTIIPINTVDVTRKRPFFFRFFPIKKLDRNTSDYNILNNSVNINNTPLSRSPINASDSNSLKSATISITSKENINLSISSTNQSSSVNVIRVNKIEKPLETGNALIKPPNYTDNIETISPTEYSTVTVQKVTKSTRLNETNNSHNDTSQTINQERPSISSTLTSKSNPISVIKIPRTKSGATQQQPSSSICTVRVIKLEKSSTNIQSKIDQVKTTTHSVDQNKNVTNGITVVKLPRNSIANKSQSS